MSLTSNDYAQFISGTRYYCDGRTLIDWEKIFTLWFYTTDTTGNSGLFRTGNTTGSSVDAFVVPAGRKLCFHGVELMASGGSINGAGTNGLYMADTAINAPASSLGTNFIMIADPYPVGVASMTMIYSSFYAECRSGKYPQIGLAFTATTTATGRFYCTMEDAT